MRVLRTIATSAGSPTGIAGDWPIGLWVVQWHLNPNATAAGSISVARIDPEFNSFGPVTADRDIPAEGAGAVAAQGSSVWVAPSTGLLTRLNAVTGAGDPGRHRSERQPGRDRDHCDGAIWLTDSDANEVVRVDPTGLLTPIPVGNNADRDRRWRAALSGWSTHSTTRW